MRKKIKKEKEGETNKVRREISFPNSVGRVPERELSGRILKKILERKRKKNKNKNKKNNKIK